MSADAEPLHDALFDALFTIAMADLSGENLEDFARTAQFIALDALGLIERPRDPDIDLICTLIEGTDGEMSMRGAWRRLGECVPSRVVEFTRYAERLDEIGVVLARIERRLR